MKKYELEKNIVIYYDNQDNMGMSEKVIDFVWRNMDSDDSFELVQETHKSKVFKLNSEANTFYIKYYTPLKIAKIIKNQFREVEALRHYNTAMALQTAGIPTVLPVMAIVRKKNRLYKESIFVMEEVKGDTLERYVQKNRPGNIFRQEIVKQLADIYAKLANSYLLHQDPSFYNFVIREKYKDSLELVVIDVDNIYKLPFFPEKAITFNLVKLYTMFSYDLNQLDLPPINKEDINYFINRFLERCNYSLDKSRLMDKVLKKSAQKLKPYGIEIESYL